MTDFVLEAQAVLERVGWNLHEFDGSWYVAFPSPIPGQVKWVDCGKGATPEAALADAFLGYLRSQPERGL